MRVGLEEEEEEQTSFAEQIHVPFISFLATLLAFLLEFGGSFTGNSADCVQSATM